MSYSAAAYYGDLKGGFNPHRAIMLNLAYFGSQMHFYRSLFSQSLEAEHFEVYRYTAVNNVEKENVLKAIQRYKAEKMAAGVKETAITRLSDNRDSARYYEKVLQQKTVLKWDTTRVDYKWFLTFDSLKNKMVFKFSDTLLVMYKRDFNEIANLTRKGIGMGHQEASISWLTTLICLKDNEAVVIDSAGYGVPNVLLTTGDMGNRRLAEQLPYDFFYDQQK